MKYLLDGTRVLDLTMHLAGPYGAMLLGDMGAEVIKIEPPTGDPQRLLDPTKHGVPVIWASINRNKRSVVVDLRRPEGRELFLELVAVSDVVFSNYRHDTMERLGLGFEELKAANPRIVAGNLTGYGANGPKRDAPAYDTAIQAVSGGMSITGHPGQPPVRAGIPIADLCGGIFLSLAVVSALHRARSGDEAVQLDLSLLDGQISMLMYWAGLSLNTGYAVPPQGSGNSNVYPYGAYPTRDGHVIVAPYSSSFWPKLCAAVDLPHLVEDPRFVDNARRVEHQEELRRLLDPVFQQRTTAEWITVLEHADVPCGPVNSVAQALADPQVVARDMRMEVDIGGLPFVFPGNPVKTIPPTPTPAGPPPRFGEHTREILGDLLHKDGAAIERLAAEGVVILDDPQAPRWRGVRSGDH
jgi:crotonobetainyl-CoA:carnitine CoA-transferase CaiB-like acyl-CoA transferase